MDSICDNGFAIHPHDLHLYNIINKPVQTKQTKTRNE